MLDTFVTACAALGWPGIALLSFAAATLVPVGSEWLLAAQLSAAPTLGTQLALVLIASLANTAGGMVTYAMGSAGATVVRANPLGRRPRLRQLLARWGVAATVLGWAPWAGDGIMVAAGVLRLPWWRVLAWSAAGRTIRYLVVFQVVFSAAGP